MNMIFIKCLLKYCYTYHLIMIIDDWWWELVINDHDDDVYQKALHNSSVEVFVDLVYFISTQP